MGSDHMYHLGFGHGDFPEDSLPRYALISGDPDRAKLIADHSEVTLVKTLSENRGLCSYLCLNADGRPFLSLTSGMGGPSLSIVINELCQLGCIDTVIRVGTCGAVQPHIKAGDIIVSIAAVNHQGSARDIVGEGYPCVADPFLVVRLVETAERLGLPCHHGITASTDTFYEGQERTASSANKQLTRRNQGLIDELRHLNVLNLEMEAATLFAQANVYGFSAGCVTAVLAERSEKGEKPIGAVKEKAVERAVQLALASMIESKDEHIIEA
ncbi:MAG: nucleoside phosphorylase [Deltaproteobacteria bacterium]|nr:nucleoside phosphorylase [Deltaproteobacteria bacterium]